MKKRVIGIVGPTASGKTALSLPVAQRLGGHIVCMDSMQVYRGMDIGTAKPTQEERALVPHHLLDILSPNEAFSVTRYADLARPLLDNLPVPMLVGGTGLYLEALSRPMDFGRVSGDEALRAKYHALAEKDGPEAVHALLQKADPPTAARLHPNDLRRVIRALEVYDLTGVPLSAREKEPPPESPWDFQLYAIDWPRDMLYARVEARVDAMMKAGLLDEVRALRNAGVAPDCQSMQGLGYKELWPVIEGKAALDEAVSLIKLRTRHYAKRQLTWFRRDGRITWIPWDSDLSKAADAICRKYEA